MSIDPDPTSMSAAPHNEPASVGAGSQPASASAAAPANAGPASPAAQARPLPRILYLRAVQAALFTGEVRFARSAALDWLAAFPGDLNASLLYAQALQREGQAPLAQRIFAGLCQADPEYSAAVSAWIQTASTDEDLPLRAAWAAALGLSIPAAVEPLAWGACLREARRALQGGAPSRAEILLQPLLAEAGASPLVAVTHLQIMEASGDAPLAARLSLARHYLEHWPECQAILLLYAHWQMDAGEETQAVARLHQAATRDLGGQVARRLWGEDHPYRGLWPQELSLPLPAPLPPAAAGWLGWNRLPSGPQSGNPTPPAVSSQVLAAAKSSPASPPSAPLPSTPASGQSNAAPSFQSELERLAQRLKAPGLAHLDGRYPIYVLFTTRMGLEGHYGPSGAEAVLQALHQLERARPAAHWSTRLFLADDPASTRPLGIAPARPADPWSLKLTLSDLEATLKTRGERIGAVLIVGGPEVVPFHQLPNPLADSDAEVPSDSPYASLDENYFVPEWPVGRLPGGCDRDPAFLLQGLNRLYGRWSGAQLSYWRWLTALPDRLFHPRSREAVGYTAAVWKPASREVFRPVGGPRRLWVSPPVDAQPATPVHAARRVAFFNAVRRAPVGYFNLHGLSDAPEWYGQRLPAAPDDEPDYPVALQPQDFSLAAPGKAYAPAVVFSEACYGAHLAGKTHATAMALRFLAAGTQAFVGSTCMAYGSLGAPLAAADLLARAFWEALHRGQPAGFALQHAKLALAQEMQRRQGCLDSEDQKTLIAFVLYGDPLAQPFPWRAPAGAKARVGAKIPAASLTLAHPSALESRPGAVSPDVLAAVKQVVAHYLPEMQGASVTVREASPSVAGLAPSPTSPGPSKAGPLPPAGGNPVTPPRKGSVRKCTLQKCITFAHGAREQFAHLTLDEQGDLVKLVVSH